MLKRLSCFLTISQGEFMKTRAFCPEHIYSIEHIPFNAFDEVVVSCLDSDLSIEFIEFVKRLTNILRVPLTVSGRIDRIEKGKALFGLGADRIIVNSCLWTDPDIIRELSSIYGQQAIVGSIDVVSTPRGEAHAYNWQAKELYPSLFPSDFDKVRDSIGELVIQDVSRDGRVIGHDRQLFSEVIDRLDNDLPIHIGSCALTSWDQYVEVLTIKSVDAVAISNIHHMASESLQALRQKCKLAGIDIREP